MQLRVFSPETKSQNFKFIFETPNPYEIVEALRKQQIVSNNSENIFQDKLVDEIVPLHNLTGLRNHEQVWEMLEKIKTGRHITESDGIPNIKLVLTPDKQLLLFDGHHTLLAYSIFGTKNLSQLPHVIVTQNGDVPVSEESISIFFSEQFRELVQKDWFSYTVNWQSSDERYLEPRTVNNFRQLTDEFEEKYKNPAS